MHIGSGYIQKQNEAGEICKQCKYRKKARQLEIDRQKLIDKMKADRMEQLDDYVIYFIESYLRILGEED